MSNIYTSGSYWERHNHNSAFKAELAMQAVEKANISWPPKVRLADVGCGNGTFLKTLCDYLETAGAEYHAEGYDIAPNAISEATRRFGSTRLGFCIGNSSSMKVRYDFIFVNDVVEHLEDPYAFMRSLRNKASWYLIHLPVEVSLSHIVVGRPVASYGSFKHLQFFSFDSASVLFEEAGFNIYYAFYSAGNRILISFPASPPIRIARLLRWAAYQIHPQYASRVFGGPIMFVLRDLKGDERHCPSLQ